MGIGVILVGGVLLQRGQVEWGVLVAFALWVQRFFEPIRDLSQQYNVLQAAVEALLPDPSEREWLQARLTPLLGIADPDAVKPERAELFAAWRRLIEAMAASGPVVLVVEDLHWADPAMLEFLGHLVEHSTGLPLLILATARPELLERHPGWPAATRIPLGALSDLETAQLVAALVGRSVLPVGVQALLLERAGGNPLYAEEFVRLLADRGLLSPWLAMWLPNIILTAVGVLGLFRVSRESGTTRGGDFQEIVDGATRHVADERPGNYHENEHTNDEADEKNRDHYRGGL